MSGSSPRWPTSLAQGNFADAAAWANRSYAVAPHNGITLWMLAAANAHFGRLPEARHALALLRTALPATTLSTFRRTQHMRDPHRIEIILEGLKMTGLPED